MKKKLLFFAAIFAVLVSLACMSVEAETVADGSCGEGVTWVLDDSGTLNVSGKGVMYDWDNAYLPPWYSHAEDIKRVIIEDGVSRIGEYAFYRCTSLVDISMSDSITSISQLAFYGCTSLVSVDISAYVSSVLPNSFMDCTSLKYINVDENNSLYKSVDGILFNKNGILLIKYPQGKGSVGYIVPTNVTVIGEWAFDGCDTLETVIIPDGVSAIGTAAFQRCYSLKELRIPKSTESIGSYALNHCYDLESIKYDGTEKEWESVYKGNKWDQSTGRDTAKGTYALVFGVEDIIYGDATGDGLVDGKDLVRLKKYIAAFDYDTGTSDILLEAGADATGDGMIDGKDLVRLKKYIAAYDWDTGTSDVVLGPEKPSEVWGMTHEEFMAVPLDSEVRLETYVQATQKWWNNTVSVYCQSHDGAYFLYELACTEEDAAKLVPGTKIRVNGTKGAWAGEVEVMNGTFEFVSGGDTYIAEAFDATELLGKDELIDHQNEYAVFKGMTVEKIEYKNCTPGDDIYVTLKKGDASYNFMVEYNLTGADTEVYKAVGKLMAGDVVDVWGFIYWYEGVNPHITNLIKK